jgi:multiple sugar transport system permease protein
MQDKTWEYTSANLAALLSALLIMFAFIFLPWYGSALTENGARILSDNLYGSVGAKPAPLIWLVPIVSLGGILFGLFGIFSAERSRLSALVCLGLGLVGLGYFLYMLSNPILRQKGSSPGIGFWVSLAGALILTVSLVLASPALRNAVQSRQKANAEPCLRVPRKAVPYLFLLAPLIIYLAWIIIPTFYTMFLSLTNWDGISTPKYIGFANFERLFTKDRTFIESLLNNLKWLLIFITVPTTIGLALAMVFNQEMVGGRLFKVSFYSPLVLSLAVIGLIWAWLYNPQYGLINQFLTRVGVADPPGWLGERGLAIYSVITAAVWRQVGYVMVLYLAGLKNIDPTFVDAARVDGANRWQLFQHVIFPLLAPVTTIVVVISIIDSLRAFDLISIMTRGGQSTQVLANFMYIEAFNNYRMGYGAAIAVVLFFISMIFIGFYLSRVIKDEMEY